MWWEGVQILDSPATTSAVTYKVQVITGGSGPNGQSFWLNRSANQALNSGRVTTSNITLQELR
jgi:hypothetical protein